MADGSVRFIKETIESWKVDPRTGYTLGISQDANGFYHRDPKVDNPPRVYQALSTIAGGELISADSY
jgi:hypothetical protein